MTNYKGLCLSFTTLLLALNISGNGAFAQSKWSEASSKQLYTVIRNDIESLSLTDATKKEFALLCLSKFKKQLPNGIIGLSQEQYRELALKFGKETFIDLNNPELRYWVISKEDRLYKSLEKQYKSIITDKVSLKTVMNCILNKLFKEYPNGIDSKTEKERFDIYYNIGHECAQSIELPVIKWTTATEDAIRIKMLTYFEKTDMSELQKVVYTTCFIEKMKKKYPNGMSGNLEKEFEAAMSDCLKDYSEK